MNFDGPESALSDWLESAVKADVLTRPVTGWLGKLGLKTSLNGVSEGVADWETCRGHHSNYEPHTTA